MSQFYHPSNSFNNFPPHIRQGIYGDSRVNPIFNNGNVKFPRVYLNFLINVIGNCFYYRMTKRIRWVSINTRPTDSSSPGSRTLKKNLRYFPISRIKWINVIFSIIIIGITFWQKRPLSPLLPPVLQSLTHRAFLAVIYFRRLRPLFPTAAVNVNSSEKMMTKANFPSFPLKWICKSILFPQQFKTSFSFMIIWFKFPEFRLPFWQVQLTEKCWMTPVKLRRSFLLKMMTTNRPILLS